MAQPPPAFANGPPDPALEQRIAKLAEFAAKNGPAFVDMIIQKQAANPEYAFLVGGLGADYFNWRLYCYLHDLQPDRPLSLAPGQPHQAQQQGAAPAPAAPAPPPGAQQLPPEVDASFAAVLARLSGTRASIKESKEWFLAHARFARGLAARMLAHQQRLPGYEQQLHVIYLANDVLLKSLPDREQGQDAVARGFQEPLPAMLHAACRAGGSALEVQERLGTIADNWQARGVFAPAFVAELKRAMLHGPAPAPAPLQQQQQQQQQAPPEQPLAGFGQPPPQHQMHAHLRPQPYQQLPQHSQPFQQPAQQHWAPHPHPPPGGAPAWSQPPLQPQPPPPPQLQHGLPPHRSAALQHAPPPPQQQQPFQPRAEPRGWQALPPGGTQPQPPFAMPPPGQPHPQPHAQPMPGAWGPPGGRPAPPSGGPPPGPPPAAPPAKEPVDPMGFPPGLLPGLVLEQLRTEEAYAPLSERDVAAAPTPAGGEPGPRLHARLAKFYAELQDYRPGSSRADLEEALRRSRQQAGPGPAPQPAASDGSFRGERPAGSGPAGLGFAAAPGGPEDPYSAYRKQRSGAYYETLGRMMAANQTQQQPAG